MNDPRDTPPEAMPAADESSEGSTPETQASSSAVSGAASPMGLQAKLVLVGLVLVALFALFWPRGDGSFAAPGGFLTDAAGRPETLGPRMRPVTLVHFWATWCPPCLTEIPTLDRLMDDFAVHRDFEILMIAVQDDVAKVETFLGDDAGAVLYDHDWDVAHRYGTRKLPETYLVVNGEVVKRWEGAQNWDDPELRERIQEALERENPQERDHGGDPPGAPVDASTLG